MASSSTAINTKELYAPYIKAINDNKAEYDESLKRCHTQFKTAREKLLLEYPARDPSAPMNLSMSTSDVISQSKAYDEKYQAIEKDWSEKTAAIDKQFKEKQAFLLNQIKEIKQQVVSKT